MNEIRLDYLSNHCKISPRIKWHFEGVSFHLGTTPPHRLKASAGPCAEVYERHLPRDLFLSHFVCLATVSRTADPLGATLLAGLHPHAPAHLRLAAGPCPQSNNLVVGVADVTARATQLWCWWPTPLARGRVNLYQLVSHASPAFSPTRGPLHLAPLSLLQAVRGQPVRSDYR